MKLYKRDYRRLTKEEKDRWQALVQEEVVSKMGKFEIRRSKYFEYPKAARHFISLFPNNLLDIIELNDEKHLRSVIVGFMSILDSADVSERNIIDFISTNQAYFLLGSLLKPYFHFGHHDAFLFPEFQLGNSFKADYLLLGRASDGWHFVFVELEAPRGKITVADGGLGEAFRKGLSQVEDWDLWLESRFSTLSESFMKELKKGESLPDEFHHLDKTRINYVVIAGRRSDFDEKTYRIRRKNQKDNSVLILHYDNVIDSAEKIIGEATY